jgi:hypothetical protein
MDFSCGLFPDRRSPEIASLAETLGYRRVWVYDSPALGADVWVTLARIAERTKTIGLGPGVLVPSLRHVMVTAAAIGTVEQLAPGRLAVAVSTGFTGRVLLGERSMRWSAVADYSSSRPVQTSLVKSCRSQTPLGSQEARPRGRGSIELRKKRGLTSLSEELSLLEGPRMRSGRLLSS